MGCFSSWVISKRGKHNDNEVLCGFVLLFHLGRFRSQRSGTINRIRATDSKPAAAADTSTTSAKNATDSAPDTKPEGKFKGRIPNGWSKLKLTDLQKQEIYKIDETYKQQIEAAKKTIS